MISEYICKAGNQIVLRVDNRLTDAALAKELKDHLKKNGPFAELILGMYRLPLSTLIVLNKTSGPLEVEKFRGEYMQRLQAHRERCLRLLVRPLGVMFARRGDEGRDLDLGLTLDSAPGE